MRRQLLGLVLGTTLFAVVLLGALLIALVWRSQVTTAQDRADEIAHSAASGIEDGVEKGKPLTTTLLQSYVRDGAVISATVNDGEPVTVGQADVTDAFTASATYGDATVTVWIPRSTVTAQVLKWALLVVALSVVALAAAWVVAWFYARRLTRPLEDFARQSERLSTGDGRALGTRYGVPELDSVAEVLDRGVTGFTGLLEDERRVTNEISHQLRTPLTGLTLRLDAVLMADSLDEARDEARAALIQAERLSGVLDEVVAVRRGKGLAPHAPTSLDDLVAAQIEEWSPAFAKAGRTLESTGDRGLVVDVVRGAQAQALATLVENSLAHGGGCTRLRVRRSGTWAVIEVSDEGAGVPAEIEERVFERHVSGAASTGLGLGLARTLVAADGGRLQMLSARPAVFAMFLPSVVDEDEVDEDETDETVVGQTVVGQTVLG